MFSNFKLHIYIHKYLYGYGSIPIDTFLVGWTSIYQLFWGSLPGFWPIPISYPHHGAYLLIAISFGCWVFSTTKTPAAWWHHRHGPWLGTWNSPGIHGVFRILDSKTQKFWKKNKKKLESSHHQKSPEKKQGPLESCELPSNKNLS